MLLEIIYKVYAYLFARTLFIKFNRFLFNLSLRGQGVLNFGNNYLTGEEGWLKNYIKDIKSPIIIDVGANQGLYSKTVVKINPTSLVFAFEPHPKTFKILSNNLLSSHFQVFNLGVGKTNDYLKLYDYNTKDGSTHASLYKDVIEEIHKSTAISHNVSVINLNDFLSEKNIDSIDLLKIDTEGNEYKVLEGVSNYLLNNKIRAIHFEFNEMNIISKSSFKEFWDYLPNYNIYRLLPGGEKVHLKKYSPIFNEIYAYQNIVAILK